MLVDKKNFFLKRMAATVKTVRQKEGPLAGAVRMARLGLPKEDRAVIDKFIVAGAV